MGRTQTVGFPAQRKKETQNEALMDGARVPQTPLAAISCWADLCFPLQHTKRQLASQEPVQMAIQHKPRDGAAISVPLKMG